MAKQDDYVRYTIRVPSVLYGKLQEAAGEKSVNAEIVTRLESSFNPDLHHEPLTPEIFEQMFEGGRAGTAIDAQTRAIEEMQARLEHLTGALSIFGFAIDRAVKGDDSDLKGLMEIARRNPIPNPPKKDDK